MIVQDQEREEIDRLFALLASASELERREVEEQIFRRFDRFIEGLARRYSGKGVADDDLRQVANLAFLKAVRRFRADRGNFASFASVTVQGELKKHFRDHAWLVRPPRSIQELQPRIRAFEAAFTHQSGHAPTVAEVAEELDVKANEVTLAKANNSYSAKSLDAPLASGPGDERTYGDLLSYEDDEFATAEFRSSVAPIIGSLPVADQFLLRLRFFDDLTQQEIASVLGITQMQVSRQLARLFKSIRDRFGDDELPIAA